VSAIAAALAPPASVELPDDTIPADAAAAYAKGGVVGEMIVERDRHIAELKGSVAARDARIKTLEYVAKRALTIGSRITADVEKLLALIDERDASSGAAPDLETAAEAEAEAPAVEGAPATAGVPERDTGTALGTLAVIHPAGLTEAAWAARAGYSRKGGAWNARRRRFVEAGWIERRDGRWFATAAGVAAAGGSVPNMPPAGPALVQWWSSRLGAAGRLLKLLADVHPREVTRQQLAALANMAASGGAFGGRVGELKAAELITDRNKKLGLAPGLMGDA